MFKLAKIFLGSHLKLLCTINGESRLNLSYDTHKRLRSECMGEEAEAEVSNYP